MNCAHPDGFVFRLLGPPYCRHCLMGPPPLIEQIRAIVREEIRSALNEPRPGPPEG